MKVDFFRQSCRRSVCDIRFGLCDDDNNNPSYIDLTNEHKWIATVINPEKRDVTFTAIDNCIDIYRDDGTMDSRCDVMLIYDSGLMFVELKCKRKDWKSEGLEQIKATLDRMIHDVPAFYNSFSKRKAIVANSKRKFPCFEKYDTAQRERFKNEYGIRIQFEAEIVIK